MLTERLHKITSLKEDVKDIKEEIMSPSMKTNVFAHESEGIRAPFHHTLPAKPTPHFTSPPQGKDELSTSIRTCSVAPRTLLGSISASLSLENGMKARQSPAKHLTQQV